MHLDEFNRLDADSAGSFVAVWAAVPTWVDAVVAARPFSSVDDLAAHAEGLSAQWGASELDAALAHHPRIGEKPQGSGAEASASRSEQSAMSDASGDVTARIADGNAAYEERFGRVFLIRAAGRSPDEILSELQRRLANDNVSEAAEATRQLAEIAVLRLRGSVTDAGSSARVGP